MEDRTAQTSFRISTLVAVTITVTINTTKEARKRKSANRSRSSARRTARVRHGTLRNQKTEKEKTKRGL
jgi:flagellar basal body L-ring protein FlgH